jgi:H+/Cl- antiporter ClcA
VRQFIRRDKTPVAILLMAALVGTLAGLLGVAFDKAVEWVQQQRLASLAQVADSWILVWPLAFILSAALAALLPRTQDVPEAARLAKDYLVRAIARSGELEVGSGHGPVQHFHPWWPASQ